MSASIWYCYAVAWPLASDDDLGELTGIHGAPVHQVRHGDLAAIVSPVPADEFDEATLPTKLEDLDWLEAVARAHNTVVDWVVQRSTTLPFRLGTIYLDQHRIRDALASEGHRLGAALDRVHGRLEWGLKVYAEHIPATTPAPETTAPAASDDSGPGRSYLRRRKATRDAREADQQETAKQAAEVDHALSELATGRRQHRVQSQELSGASGQNILNVAYLVPGLDTEPFLDRVRQLRDYAASCTIEVTGPWAPYSFAVDDLVATTDVEAEPR